MFPFSRRSPARPNRPTISSVTLALPGFEAVEDGPTTRRWTDTSHDALSLNFFDLPPDLPSNLVSVDDLRTFYLEQLARTSAKLVDVGTTSVASARAICLIVKAPQRPHGMTYLGSYTIPFRDFSYVIKLQCHELGTTGIREAVLFDKLFHAKRIAPDPASGKILGEWNPDDERYDRDFPDHPLSRLRRHLASIAVACRLDPALASYPAFPLP